MPSAKLPAILVLLAALAMACFTDSSAPAAIVVPSGKTIDKVDFERHVMGIFGRSGCNMGSCHGSFQGKGGFRLSLFGFEPERDYFGITRDGTSRRINVNDPDS